MQVPDPTFDPYDLTGQVTLVDYMPEFEGNYSMVFRGDVEGKLVAVKVIKATGEPKSVRRKVLRERTIWASILHPNIHPYYGFAEDPKFGPVRAPYGAMVSPWCNNGDAAKFLKEHGEHMSIDDRVEIWKGAIDGVAHLHSQTPVIIHGDLKPGNVLIDDAGKPRICDFGLAHVFFDEPGSGLTTTTEHTGTERYLAPELVIDDANVRPTMASDVYALGCLGLDFVYLQQPYSHRKNNTRGIIFADIRKGIPPAGHLPDLSPGFSSLLKSCWNREPNARPLALTITRELRKRCPILPLELVDRIINFASEVPRENFYGMRGVTGWRERTRALLALSLASREYRKLAIPHLYRDIRFLNLDPGISAPTLLLCALKMNAEDALDGDRTYESYTTSLIYHTYSLWTGGLVPSDFNALWGLIQRLDALKSIVVKWGYHEESSTNPYDITVLPQTPGDSALLTSVTFSGLTFEIVMEGLMAFGNLQNLQELRIISATCNTQGYSKLNALPTLESLVIEGTSNVLDLFLWTLSQWECPRLTSLHLTYYQGGSRPPSHLDRFLSFHGDSLRMLTCHTRQHRLHQMGTILQYCPNLQYISYPMWEPYLLDLVSRHESLVDMNLLYSIPFSHVQEDPRFATQALHQFRRLIRARCPRLFTARVFVRSYDGVLRQAAFINVQHGTVFEWDRIVVSNDSRIGWIQTVE